MPRPRSLTPDAVAAAALAVLDRGGLGSLSMRNVARELGVSTMALYKYVTDRAELEQLIVEAVLSPVVVDVPGQTPWNERVALLVERVRDAAGAHPEAVPLLLTHRHTSHRTLQWIEAMLGVLTDAGFTDTGRVIAQRTLVNYLVGTIQADHLGSLAGAGTGAMTALPASEFPHLVRTARTARDVEPDEEFRRGLTILIEGLVAVLRTDAPTDSPA